MIKAIAKSANSFLYIIDASIFSEKVITKALYWYSDSFIIYWDRNNNTYEVTLELKPNASHLYTFDYVTQKFNQDLIDFKNTYIIIANTILDKI